MSSILTPQAPRQRAPWGGLLFILISLITLQGCVEQKPKMIGVPIEGYSHTSAAINWFMVNRNGGPNISPYSGGGSQMCCVPLPVKWHPGLTVVVEWEKDPNPHSSGSWPKPVYSDAWRAAAREHETHYTRHRAVAAVPRYERPGAIDVHFLPCNQVAVSAVAELPGQPGYPFNFPKKMDEPKTCPAP